MQTQDRGRPIARALPGRCLPGFLLAFLTALLLAADEKAPRPAAPEPPFERIVELNAAGLFGGEVKVERDRFTLQLPGDGSFARGFDAGRRLHRRARGGQGSHGAEDAARRRRGPLLRRRPRPRQRRLALRACRRLGDDVQASHSLRAGGSPDDLALSARREGEGVHPVELPTGPPPQGEGPGQGRGEQRSHATPCSLHAAPCSLPEMPCNRLSTPFKPPATRLNDLATPFNGLAKPCNDPATPFDERVSPFDERATPPPSRGSRKSRILRPRVRTYTPARPASRRSRGSGTARAAGAGPGRGSRGGRARP